MRRQTADTLSSNNFTCFKQQCFAYFMILIEFFCTEASNLGISLRGIIILLHVVR